MKLIDIFYNYLHYLIHPFQSHKEIASGEGKIKALGLYESLGVSWVFVVVAGLIRIVLINLVIFMFLNMFDPGNGILEGMMENRGFTGFYFLILTSVLDVVFYPLITMFILQFWEFVLKSYASMAGVKGDVDKKTKTILSVSLSSHILLVVPVFGEMAQKTAHFIQMYAGIREQMNFSRSLTFCVLLTPVLFFLFLATLMVLIISL
ncbi:MAG: hypothetical protein CME64_11075 [Halobacteriovoraceae bacterium]|nr:hypothetical protein [Halobacteriovoraceae bacterium]|tara:strand:+ start:147323 stop:147940 length:618 start_codon:yes stop_codon:yes gene_type:complete